MFSYEERLETFRDWPKEFRPLFVRRLAVMGQYALKDSSLTTVCVYCRKVLEGWCITDVPLVEHADHNDNECPLFRLSLISMRKRLFASHRGEKGCEAAENDAEKKMHQRTRPPSFSRDDTVRIESKFLQFNIRRGVPFKFCHCCGSVTEGHRCRASMEKINTGNLEGCRSFYIRWLRGDYIEQMDRYLETSVFIPARFTESIRFILEGLKDFKPMESIQSVAEEGIETLARAFNHSLKELEKKKIEKLMQYRENDR